MKIKVNAKVTIVSPQPEKNHIVLDVPLLPPQCPIWLRLELGLLFFRTVIYVKLV